MGPGVALHPDRHWGLRSTPMCPRTRTGAVGANLVPQGAGPDYPVPSCSNPQPGSRPDTVLPPQSQAGTQRGGALCWDPQVGHLWVGTGRVPPLEPEHGEGCLSGGIEVIASRAPLAPGSRASGVSEPVGSVPSRKETSLAPGMAGEHLSGCPQPHRQCAAFMSLNPADGRFLDSCTYAPTLAWPRCHCAWEAEPSAPCSLS